MSTRNDVKKLITDIDKDIYILTRNIDDMKDTKENVLSAPKLSRERLFLHTEVTQLRAELRSMS